MFEKIPGRRGLCITYNGVCLSLEPMGIEIESCQGTYRAGVPDCIFSYQTAHFCMYLYLGRSWNGKF
jgi:hypothetical protein